LGETFVVYSFDRAEVEETIEAAPVVKDDVKEGGELVDDLQQLEVDNHINEHGDVQVALANSQSASSVGEAEAPVEASVYGKVVDGVEQGKNDDKCNDSDEDNSAVGATTGGEEDEMEDVDSAAKDTDMADAPNIEVLKAPPVETFDNRNKRQEEEDNVGDGNNVHGSNSMDDVNDGEEKSLEDVDTFFARTEAVVAPVVGETEAPPAPNGHYVDDHSNFNNSNRHTGSESVAVDLRYDTKGRKYCMGTSVGKSGANTCSNYSQGNNGLCKACDKIFIGTISTLPPRIQPLKLVLRTEVKYNSYRAQLCVVEGCTKAAQSKCKFDGIKGRFCIAHHKCWQEENASAD